MYKLQRMHTSGKTKERRGKEPRRRFSEETEEEEDTDHGDEAIARRSTDQPRYHFVPYTLLS